MIFLSFTKGTSRAGLEASYWKKMFRAMRFTAWRKRKASVERFVDQIRKKYGNDSSNAQMVILYGNWGRRPNLKNQAPSPGIGLRRLIHASEGVTTITVHEAYTSSFDPISHRPVSEARNVHALLREEAVPPFACLWPAKGARRTNERDVHRPCLRNKTFR
jgi:hypothetical protein